MLRIVTDGAADILPQWKSEYGIDVIPVNIMFGEKSYLQGVELDNEGFYKLVDETKRIPKTSQPTLTSLWSFTVRLPRSAIRFYPFMSLPSFPAHMLRRWRLRPK